MSLDNMKDDLRELIKTQKILNVKYDGFHRKIFRRDVDLNSKRKHVESALKTSHVRFHLD